MEQQRRDFLDRLLETPSPSGFEVEGQRVWVDDVEEFADEVRTDAYGNAVAVYEGGDPEVALTGHADEIGFIVRRIDDDGFVHLGRIGGSDASVSRGQHITIHTADGPVEGVIGQSAIHLRDRDDDEVDEIWKQRADVGAEDGEHARELVEVGDPITFASGVRDLEGTRVSARGLDNRIGTWAAAEGLRRAVEADVNATVYAVSTVQEELGKRGAQMVGFDLAPDAAIAVDVTHATDYTSAKEEPATKKEADVELGGGPVIARGSSNHPELVRAVRDAADGAELPVQLQATGISTGTDADAFYTSRGGIPSLNVGVPNRYMHTPVEVIDTDDLVATADLLGAFAERASEYDGFAVEI
ncbi:endoglucanase [Halobacteriales archaeon QS_1_68_20]|nr:MAG: endoglucanase [Halobacteriales archaeon QS_1_68_20]